MRKLLAFLVIAVICGVVPAAADTVRVGNCTTNSIHVTTFNQNDGVCWVARSDVWISACEALTLECDGACKVGVNISQGCPAGTYTGKKIYTNHHGLVVPETVLDQPQASYLESCACNSIVMKQVMEVPN